MAPITHEDVRDLAPLYAAGALSPRDRASIDAHIESCPECAAEVRAMVAVALAVGQTGAQIDPPPSLRERVLAHATGEPFAAMNATAGDAVPRRAGAAATIAWLAAAAMLVVTIGATWYAGRVRADVIRLSGEVRQAVARADRAEAAATAAAGTTRTVQARLAVLTSPDLRQVDLAGQPAAPRASARAFWSRSRGVVFAAADLPPLPSGRTYQLWYLTGAAPVSAGLFKPDDSGLATAAFDAPGTPNAITGLAVSQEPDGGVTAPTGAIYLAGQAQQ